MLAIREPNQEADNCDKPAGEMTMKDSARYERGLAKFLEIYGEQAK